MSEYFAEPVEIFRGEAESAAQDAVFDVLADQARRAAIECLAMEDGAMSLEDLVDAVVGILISGEVDPYTRERTTIRFHHIHLPKMDATGLLTYDHDDRIVEPTATLDIALQFLVQDTDNRPQ